MATLEQLEAALRKADAAGNVEDATVFANEIRRLRSESVSEIPVRRASSVERFGGVGRDVGPAMGMLSPEQKREALKTGVTTAASLFAGPAVAGLVRGAGAVVPAIQRVTSPLATAIESGGFKTGLPSTAPRALQTAMRVTGGGIAGGAAGAIVSPEDAATGAAIGAAVPVAGKIVSKLISPKGPKTSDVRSAADIEYAAAERLGGEVGAPQFNELASRLAAKMDEARFNPVLHPRIRQGIEAITQEAGKEAPISLNRLDTLRRVVARGGASASPDEQRLANLAVGEIDDFIRQSMPEASVAHLEKARELWSRMRRSQTIDRLIKRASRSQDEPAQALRRLFQQLEEKRGGAVLKTFKPEEQELIKQIANGTMSAKALEMIGTIAPPRLRELRTGIGRLATTGYGALGYGAAAVNPVMTGATMIGGYASRALANRLAQTQAERLNMLIRTGQPVTDFAPKVFPQIIPAAGVNALASETR